MAVRSSQRRLDVTPCLAQAAVPTMFWNAIPITMDRTMGLNVAMPGSCLIANAAPSIIEFRTGRGSISRVLRPVLHPARRRTLSRYSQSGPNALSGDPAAVDALVYPSVFQKLPQSALKPADIWQLETIEILLKQQSRRTCLDFARGFSMNDKFSAPMAGVVISKESAGRSVVGTVASSAIGLSAL